MSQEYLFKGIRKGVTAARQIVATGYCTAEFLEERKVCAVLVQNGQEKELACEYKTARAPFNRQRKNTKAFSKLLLIMISVPSWVSSGDKLLVYAKNADGSMTTLCRIKGSKVLKTLKCINYEVSLAKEEGGAFVIRGWAIDHEDIILTLQDRKTGEFLQFPKNMPEWYVRSDAMRRFPECEQPRKPGFSIKLPLDWGERSLVMRLKAGNIVCKENIQKKDTNLLGKGLQTLYLNILRVYNNTKTFGFQSTCAKIKRRLTMMMPLSHKDYNRFAHKKLITDKQAAQQRNTTFEYRPRFSILVPLYESDETFLKALIESVQAQTYDNWELCFSDGSRDSSRLKDYLEAYEKADSRIRYIAEQAGPLGISENTNQAYKLATGDYIVLGDHDDLFTRDALFECVKALNEKKVQVIYTDEDKTDENGKTYFNPNFKPDFNIDLLRSCNYICHMFVAEKKLVDQVGLFDPAYNGAQDYDFIFRCVENADGICHIPRVLYHWRAHKVSTAEVPEAKLYAFNAGRRAIEAHLNRAGLSATVEDGDNLGQYKVRYDVQGNPLVSIVIPNKDHIDDLKKCMKSIDDNSTYRNYEYIIIENNSERQETFDYYKELEARADVNVLYWSEEFNYSRINNFGVEHARGEYILLLNNDTELINADGIEQMLGYCQREDVGIVGARLYYGDNTIQHAGVIIGYGGIAGHIFVTLNEDDGLYQSRTMVACDYSAVTAACLMTKKSVYDAVGGLEPGFRVAFNDVDFCMKVRELGKLVVYVPQATFYHYESKSRGLEDTPEKRARFDNEKALFLKRWPDILANGDPYYNVNLSLDSADCSVRA